MSLEINQDIKDKLDYFIEIKKVPNIIFHGPTGSGKKFILKYFLNSIYNSDQETMKNNIMHVNCAHGKGIKFIREDLKLFAKTNINFNNGYFFKSIILLNADKLTIDAQSALRRCIESFTYSTRFFIIVEDKYKLLKPILSRFCEIFVNLPIINNKTINLYEYSLRETYDFKSEKLKRYNSLCILLNKKLTNISELFCLTEKLYNKAYSGVDLVEYIKNKFPENEEKYKLLITFYKIKKEFRSEKLCILYLLNNIYFRSNVNLENISFM